jgi:hypothetical protein
MEIKVFAYNTTMVLKYGLLVEMRITLKTQMYNDKQPLSKWDGCKQLFEKMVIYTLSTFQPDVLWIGDMKRQSI